MRSSVLIASLAALSAVSARNIPRSIPPKPRAAATFGSCGNPAIIFADGLDGRNTAAFEPADESSFNHGSALGIAVITSFICQQLNDKCHASAAQIADCNTGATAAAALTGQAAADAFNAALGVTADGSSTSSSGTTTTAAPPTATTTDCASTITTMVTVTSTPAAVLVAATTTSESVCVPTTVTATVTVTSAAEAAATTTVGSSTSTSSAAVVSSTPPALSTTVTNTGNLTFGSCTDPTVIFAFGLDGRKATEASFEPHDQTQFNHNTALNSAIIYQFQCDNLVNVCGFKEADETVTICRNAGSTALATGNNGAGADKFNGLLGFVTNFAALDSQLTTTATKRMQKVRRNPIQALKDTVKLARERGLNGARRVAEWE